MSGVDRHESTSRGGAASNVAPGPAEGDHGPDPRPFPAPGSPVNRRRLFFLLLAALTAALAAVSSCAHMENYSAATAPVTRWAPDRPPPPAPDTLRVVTFNIQFSERVDAALTELRTDPDLRDPDILLLQEMEGGDVRRLARELGLHAAYIPASHHSKHDEDFGNAVLSRWPLTDVRGVDLPNRQPWNGQRRMAVLATAQLPDGPLHCVSVHLEVPTLGTRKRVEQLQAVADAVAERPGPVVVGGDFNCVLDRDAQLLGRVLRRAGFREAHGQGPTARRGLILWKFQEGVLDRVFGRGLAPAAAGAPPSTAASDHLPVWSRWTRP